MERQENSAGEAARPVRNNNVPTGCKEQSVVRSTEEENKVKNTSRVTKRLLQGSVSPRTLLIFPYIFHLRHMYKHIFHVMLKQALHYIMKREKL